MNRSLKLNASRYNMATILCLFVIGIMIMGVSVNITSTNASMNNAGEIKISSSYIDLPSGFVCSGDACFGPLATTISNAGGSLLGTGTQNDPYIIENLNITGFSGILFSSITKYVIIRDILIDSASSTGITLENIANTVIIENNNISSPSGAVRAVKINSSVVIRDNYFHDNGGWTLTLGESNPGLGFGVMNSSIVYNNTLINNYRGIQAYYTNETRIYNNTIVNNQIEAMQAATNDELFIYNNTVSNSGFGIKFWESNNFTLVENNTITDITSETSTALGFTFWTVGLNTPKIIKNNVLTNLAGTGIGAGNNATITNNTIQNVNGSGIATGHNATVQDNLIVDFGLGQFQRDAITVSQNSTVSNNHILRGLGSGIYVEDNSVVMNNQIDDVQGFGIRIQNPNFKVMGNTITRSGGNGIDIISNSDGTTQDIVSSNSIYGSQQNGISLKFSKGIIVESNTITYSGGSGIYLEGSMDNVIRSNVISLSKLFSIYAVSSPSTFELNTLEHEIAVDVDSTYTFMATQFFGYKFTDNTVHGLPFGFFMNATTDISTQYGQLLIINAVNIVITNNNFENRKIPITVYASYGVLLSGLTLNNNSYYAIRHKGQTSFLTIEDSTISNTHGVGITSDAELNIHNSKIIDNKGNGVYLNNRGKISNNEISRNNGSGVVLGKFAFNSPEIFDNKFEDNIKYGVSIETSYSGMTQGATIHHNNFIRNNAGGGSQASDNGTGNTWYDAFIMEGNYWMDWSGSGSYAIDGTSNSEDIYPFGIAITLPRTIPDNTDTMSGTTTDPIPTDTEPSDTFDPASSEEDTEAGLLLSPSISVLGMMLMVFIVNIRRRKNK